MEEVVDQQLNNAVVNLVLQAYKEVFENPISVGEKEKVSDKNENDLPLGVQNKYKAISWADTCEEDEHEIRENEEEDAAPNNNNKKLIFTGQKEETPKFRAK